MAQNIEDLSQKRVTSIQSSLEQSMLTPKQKLAFLSGARISAEATRDLLTHGQFSRNLQESIIQHQTLQTACQELVSLGFGYFKPQELDNLLSQTPDDTLDFTHLSLALRSKITQETNSIQDQVMQGEPNPDSDTSIEAIENRFVQLKLSQPLLTLDQIDQAISALHQRGPDTSIDKTELLSLYPKDYLQSSQSNFPANEPSPTQTPNLLQAAADQLGISLDQLHQFVQAGLETNPQPKNPEKPDSLETLLHPDYFHQLLDQLTLTRDSRFVHFDLSTIAQSLILPEHAQNPNIQAQTYQLVIDTKDQLARDLEIIATDNFGHNLVNLADATDYLADIYPDSRPTLQLITNRFPDMLVDEFIQGVLNRFNDTPKPNFSLASDLATQLNTDITNIEAIILNSTDAHLGQDYFQTSSGFHISNTYLNTIYHEVDANRQPSVRIRMLQLLVEIDPESGQLIHDIDSIVDTIVQEYPNKNYDRDTLRTNNTFGSSKNFLNSLLRDQSDTYPTITVDQALQQIRPGLRFDQGYPKLFADISTQFGHLTVADFIQGVTNRFSRNHSDWQPPTNKPQIIQQVCLDHPYLTPGVHFQVNLNPHPGIGRSKQQLLLSPIGQEVINAALDISKKDPNAQHLLEKVDHVLQTREANLNITPSELTWTGEYLATQFLQTHQQLIEETLLPQITPDLDSPTTLMDLVTYLNLPNHNFAADFSRLATYHRSNCCDQNPDFPTMNSQALTTGKNELSRIAFRLMETTEGFGIINPADKISHQKALKLELDQQLDMIGYRILTDIIDRIHKYKPSLLAHPLHDMIRDFTSNNSNHHTITWENDF